MTSALATSAPAGLGRHTDLALAGLVVAVIVMMALPLPPWSLDILVALNIFLAVVLLLVALFIPTPLAFSTFPSVLLITTLFRISLNVATTRQILLHAHAGDIINAFGKLVVGGSLIVGIVVFLIITVVQFIVIAKGAERVAEVSARFTLDALPGKQMSIDADVRAGLISQSEAVVKRRELIQESQFYGAMDGAMKFVKGDAIAGIVIVLVNLLGGIAIGTLVMNLGFGAAVQKFSILSIGDGLVTQIPALFVSIAAGIAITRTAPDNSAHLGDQIGKQLGSQPRALMLAGGVMFLFALVPGFPTFTFLGLGAAVAALSTMLSRRIRDSHEARVQLEVHAAAREGEQTPMTLQVGRLPGRPPSAFRIEFGADLARRIGAAELNAALARERILLREEFGIPFPGAVLEIVPGLPPQSFAVVVQDLSDSAVEFPESAVLALARDAAAIDALASQPALDGVVPELLAPAQWVAAANAQALRQQGVELLSAADVVARTLVRVIQKNASIALGVQEAKLLVREIEWRFADLVREAQAVLPLPRIADLMAALARERVPLTDFPGLLQALVTSGPSAADSNGLYESMRLGLARNIVARLLIPGNTRLGVVCLDAEFESQLRSVLLMRPDGPVLAMQPDQADAAAVALKAAFAAVVPRGVQTLLLPTDLRRAVSRLFRSILPRVAFLSQDELQAANVGVDVVASARLSAAPS